MNANILNALVTSNPKPLFDSEEKNKVRSIMIDIVDDDMKQKTELTIHARKSAGDEVFKKIKKGDYITLLNVRVVKKDGKFTFIIYDRDSVKRLDIAALYDFGDISAEKFI